MKICRIFTFDAAHYLPNYEGKCKNLHGHTWTLEVEVSGDVKDDGMVIDFAKLKDLVNHRVIDILDHRLLNDVIANPTCENLLFWMRDNLGAWLNVLSCELVRLRLYETPDSFAELKL